MLPPLGYAFNDDQHQWGLILHITGDPKQDGRVYVGTHGRGIVYGDPQHTPASAVPFRSLRLLAALLSDTMGADAPAEARAEDEEVKIEVHERGPRTTARRDFPRLII